MNNESGTKYNAKLCELASKIIYEKLITKCLVKKGKYSGRKIKRN